MRPDVDNVAKPILDALAGIVYQDDRQVQELTISAIPRGEVFRTEFLRPASP